MYIEMLIIAIIVIYMFMVNGKINKDNIFTNNSKLCNLLKEKEHKIELMENSTSWKITEPLRKIRSKKRGAQK